MITGAEVLWIIYACLAVLAFGGLAVYHRRAWNKWREQARAEQPERECFYSAWRLVNR